MSNIDSNKSVLSEHTSDAHTGFASIKQISVEMRDVTSLIEIKEHSVSD